MKVWIYALVDPRDDEIRYVGKTNDLVLRYKRHQDTVGNRIFWEWKQELFSLGLTFSIITLEITTDDRADMCEWRWIEWAHRSGCNLLNRQGMKRLR